MKNFVKLLLCLSTILNAEWISFGKGFGNEAYWQESNRSMQTLEYKITIPGIASENKTDGGGFKLFSFTPELYRECAEGEPKVPMLRQFLAIPECSGATIEVIPGETITYENTRLYPRGKDVVQGGTLIERYTTAWQNFYSQINGFYPAVGHKLGLPAIRGQRVADLELYPVSFSPTENKIKVITEYTVRITFTNPTGGYSVNTGIFNGAISGNVLGYNDNTGITASINTGKEAVADVRINCSPSDGVDYLFIVSDDLWNQPEAMTALDSLAKWRSKYNGFKVGMLKRSSITGEISSSSTNPHYKNIRDYIAQFYNEGVASHTYDGHIAYVCLVGDYTVYKPNRGLPPSYDKVGGEFRYEDGEEIENPKADNLSYTFCASDYYYSCVTKDAITHEYDELGDLFIGRIPAGDATELTNYVNKVLAYEPLENKPVGNEWHPDFWRNKIWVMNGNPLNFWGVNPTTGQNVLVWSDLHGSIDPMLSTLFNNNASGFAPYNVHLTSLGNDDTGSLSDVDSRELIPFYPPLDFGVNGHLVRDKYVEIFNTQPWLIEYNDHGQQYGWAGFYNKSDNWPQAELYPNSTNQSHPQLHNGTLVNNKCRLPFVISEACETGWFDNKDNLSQNCFAEDLLLKDSNGAIGMIANQRAEAVNFAVVNDKIYSNLMKKNLQQIGESLAGAKLDPWFNSRHAFSHNLYCDPALNLFYDQNTLTMPDYVVKITDRDPLKYKYFSSFPCNLDIKLRISNFGKLDNQNPVTLKVYVDGENQSALVNEQNNIFIDQPRDFEISISRLTEGWHKIYAKVFVSGTEISSDNNSDVVDVYVGKYQTGYPYKADINVLKIVDYDQDGQDDFVTDQGIYNQNKQLIETLPINSFFTGSGQLSKGDPTLLFESNNRNKLYLKSRNSSMKEIVIPNNLFIEKVKFVNYYKNSGTQQIFILTSNNATNLSDAQNNIFLITEDLQLKQLYQIDGKGVSNIFAIMDFDRDGLTDIIYNYGRDPELFGFIFGNGTELDEINAGNVRWSENNLILDFDYDGLCDIISIIDSKLVLCKGNSVAGEPDFSNHVPLLNEINSNLIRFTSSSKKNYLLCWSGSGLVAISSDNGFVSTNIPSDIQIGSDCSVKLELFRNNNKNMLLIYSYTETTKLLNGAYVLEISEQTNGFSAQHVSKTTFLPFVKSQDVNLTKMNNNLLGYSLLSEEGIISYPNNKIHLLRDEIQLVNFTKDAVYLNNMHEMQLPNYLTQNKLSAFNYNLTGIWYIDESLTIPRDQTLTLAPNTKLLFAPNTSLTILGDLTIKAELGNEVVFCAQESGRTWAGIKGNSSNSINLDNVIIRDAVTGISGFFDNQISNTTLTNCNTAINLSDAQALELYSCKLTDCTNGVIISNRSNSIFSSYNISNCQFTGTSISGRTNGISILNSFPFCSINLERNTINKYQYGISLSYVNALLNDNNVSDCYTGIRLFESSPVLADNIISKNTYGVNAIGYSSPVLNPFGSSLASGGYNRISDNSYRQLLFDANSRVLLDDGRNDIFDDTQVSLLIDKSAFIGRTIPISNNFWGNNFLETSPALFFAPFSSFAFIPYSTTPFTISEKELVIPADEELSKFDLALKKELSDESEAAFSKYQEVLAEDSIEASAVLPRLEYTTKFVEKSNVVDLTDLLNTGKINSFTYSTAQARSALLAKNYEDASSFYLMKLDSADLHLDSLIAKVNLLDFIWNNNGKSTTKAEQNHSELVCKSKDDYISKRENLLGELSREKTSVNSENIITDFNLSQNYPNPFNPSTVIRYALPKTGDVKICVYNITGALVCELKEGIKNKGIYQTVFNGNKVSAGVYIYTLDFNGKTLMTKKMVMVK